MNTQIVIPHESFWGLRNESLHTGALFDSTGMSAYMEILYIGLHIQIFIEIWEQLWTLREGPHAYPRASRGQKQSWGESETHILCTENFFNYSNGFLENLKCSDT